MMTSRKIGKRKEKRI